MLSEFQLQPPGVGAGDYSYEPSTACEKSEAKSLVTDSSSGEPVAVQFAVLAETRNIVAPHQEKPQLLTLVKPS